MKSAKQEGELPLSSQRSSFAHSPTPLKQKEAGRASDCRSDSTAAVCSPSTDSERSFVILPSNTVRVYQTHYKNMVKYKQTVRELLRCLWYVQNKLFF